MQRFLKIQLDCTARAYSRRLLRNTRPSGSNTRRLRCWRAAPHGSHANVPDRHISIPAEPPQKSKKRLCFRTVSVSPSYELIRHRMPINKIHAFITAMLFDNVPYISFILIINNVSSILRSEDIQQAKAHNKRNCARSSFCYGSGLYPNRLLYLIRHLPVLI